jgi:hypothetical protein
MLKKILLISILISSISANAQHHMTQMESPNSFGDCGHMMAFDRTTLSCSGVPMAGMSMGMWMIHGNAFLVETAEEGARGRSRLSSVNMLMTELGHSYGNNYLNVDLMLTAERWTLPGGGYPELLQIGEKDENGSPYIDAQHPHSSPIMGLTFSDTIAINDRGDYVKIFFAPRGQATEGPVAFMHRPTGMVNPDAPLGHHIGQDVAHITSTVLGASISKDKFQFEVSAFNGLEPEPTKVDLPSRELNSYAARLVYEFSNQLIGMISYSEVKDPEPNDPTLKKMQRYSASLYGKHIFSDSSVLQNTLIYGQVANLDHISILRSALDEFWIAQKDQPHNYWGRIEAVERTADQLAILTAANPQQAQWVWGLTAGYTYKIKLGDDLEAGLGASVTKDLLPGEFRAAYSGDPVSGKIFLQVSGMTMGQF